ncbi:uncharacterized protein LOC119445253 [Dermacentor silvarum]|uniref:uncharacterized protein LOC119445253 n=1 Tax=Dermacentor silvarum TaxID=543639 RepID=UPI002100F318|nr:uncharacterized protein LOC119445253 [Dermacentor silvarum]
MVEEIRASLLLLLRGSDVSWLNEQSKEIAIKKVRTLCRAVRMFSIGDTDIVPLQIRRLRLIQQPINSTTLDWEPPVLHPESSFGSNVAILLSSRAEQNWKRLGRYNYFDSVPVPQLRMGISYDVYRNAIVVPAILTGLGLSTPGILALDLSPSINFGAFGYLVAHEMLRSIMFSGSCQQLGAVADAQPGTRHRFDRSAGRFQELVPHQTSHLRIVLHRGCQSAATRTQGEPYPNGLRKIRQDIRLPAGRYYDAPLQVQHMVEKKHERQTEKETRRHCSRKRMKRRLRS